MLVWQHGSVGCSCKCPLCRRAISLLVPTEESLRQQQDPEVSQILSKIHAYNRFFGGQPTTLYQRLRDLPFLLHRLLREFLHPHRSLPLLIRARVFVVVSSLSSAFNHLFITFYVCALVFLLFSFMFRMACVSHKNS